MECSQIYAKNAVRDRLASIIEGTSLFCPVFSPVYLVDVVFLLNPGQWKKGTGIFGFFNGNSKL